MSAASRGRPSVRAWRIAVDDTSRPAISTSGAMVVAKPKRSPKVRKSCAVPARPLPKQKSAPTTTWAMPRPLARTSRANSSGVRAARARLKGSWKQMLHPQLRQPVGPGLGVHQAEGRGVGCEELAGVRLEGDDAQLAMVAGKVDDRGMAQMHAVEIAHGNGCTACIRVKPLEVLMNLHPRPCRGRLPRQSNLRLGARTSASPFNTTVLPTEARVSRVTRRFAWSIAVTVTSARTMSPGRTGAMNLRLCPR